MRDIRRLLFYIRDDGEMVVYPPIGVKRSVDNYVYVEIRLTAFCRGNRNSRH